MAQKKGRRNKASRDRQSTGAAPGPAQTAAGRTRPPMPPTTPLPSRNARATGFMVALVTAFLAIVVIRDAIASGGGVESIIRIVTGVALVALAMVVAALVLFPGQLQRYFARRRGA